MIEEPGDAMVPGDRLAVRVEAGGNAVEVIGPVHVVLDVLLAGPHDLHRTVHLLGDLDRLGDAVDLEPAAEAAAEQVIVDHDLVQPAVPWLLRPWLALAQWPACRPRPRSRPCGRGPCSSSAPWWRAPGTAAGRSPRPWWRRPPWPCRHRRRSAPPRPARASPARADPRSPWCRARHAGRRPIRSPAPPALSSPRPCGRPPRRRRRRAARPGARR